MCQRCVDGLRHVGEPMPEWGELQERALERAAVTFEATALQHDIEITTGAQVLGGVAFRSMLDGLMEIMHEEGVVFAKGWIVLLGATRWEQLTGIRSVMDVSGGDPDAG